MHLLHGYFAFLIALVGIKTYVHGTLDGFVSSIRNLSIKRAISVPLTASTILASAIIANAATEETLKSNIASIAATIPGYGPKNVYNPTQFEGFWKAKETISSVTSLTTDLPWILERLPNLVNQSLDYQVHFKRSEDSSQIILDRSFSIASEFSAYRDNAKALTFWNEQNPNAIKTVFPNDQRVIHLTYI
jgi:hypothetical protein